MSGINLGAGSFGAHGAKDSAKEAAPDTTPDAGSADAAAGGDAIDGGGGGGDGGEEEEEELSDLDDGQPDYGGAFNPFSRELCDKCGWRGGHSLECEVMKVGPPPPEDH